jgi:hypothetical protein
MLKEITTDNFQIQKISNSKQFYNTDIDYDQYNKQKNELGNKWPKLAPAEQQKYDNKIKTYFKKNLPEYSDDEINRARHYSLLKNEVNKRITEQLQIPLLSISQLHIEQSLLELVENLENDQNIKALYKVRKLNLGDSKNSGIQSNEAARLKNCLRQGRELYLSGKVGSLMVKPLNFFYSLTAYSYAATILNNPLRYSIDHLPGSHGIIYHRSDLKIQFGGDVPHGTFSELACSFPTFFYKDKNIQIIQNNIQTSLDYFNNKVSSSIGTLLSMIPEIREYYSLVTGKQGRTYPLLIATKSEPRNVYYEFQIGDGYQIPDKSIVEKSFPGFEMSEMYGKIIIKVPTTDAHKISASIFTDSKGMFWYIENPFYPIILSEFCVHFLLINAFSNIMRYAPDQWGDILLNNVDSKISLITRKYISSLENKFMFMILRNISEYYPYVA